MKLAQLPIPALLMVAALLLAAAPEPPAATTNSPTKPNSTTTKPKQATKTKAARAGSRDLFQGFLVAQNATDAFAPEFVFRVAGWNSSWGQRKIVMLAPDGQRVKQGDVVARFEFGNEDALRYVNERIQRAQTDASQSEIAGIQIIEGLEMAARRKQIDARMATLALERVRAVSRNQGEALRIEQRLADFDVAAAAEQLESARAAQAADRSHRQQVLAAAQEGLTRYRYYVDQFVLKAPHDGVVRHAFNARERRKLEKGDNVQSGMRVLSLAKDDALAVQFFVPEAQAPSVQPGTKIAVQIPTTASELEAVVTAVDFFPQELGFLLENEGLPNGREKAIQVRATLSSAPSSSSSSSSSSPATPALAAGTEVRVKVRK